MGNRRNLSRLLTAMLVGGVSVSLLAGPANAAVPIDSSRTSYHPDGSISSDNRTDLVLTGPSGWNKMPTAFSKGNGSFDITNAYVGKFGSLAAQPNVKPLMGDFNGDHRTDVALTGGAGWTTLPVAMSDGKGSFTISNSIVDWFGGAAARANVTPIVGDFNGDNRSDIALVGGIGWNTIPVAFSNGNGSFSLTNSNVRNSFGYWAASANVKALAGDFNSDHRTDIALIGDGGWSTIPVAFSNGDGSFNVTNSNVGAFGAWAAIAGTQPLVGDFNGDNRTDVALSGGAGWLAVPVAFSNGDGSFTVSSVNIGSSFGHWAASANVKALVGDFNGDYLSDIVLTGDPGWTTLPVAFSNGDGSFEITNANVGAFGTWAASADVKALVGDFNSDHRADIALTGGAGWNTIPVAFSNGDGSFNVTNSYVGAFGGWAATSNAKALAG